VTTSIAVGGALVYQYFPAAGGAEPGMTFETAAVGIVCFLVGLVAGRYCK